MVLVVAKQKKSPGVDAKKSKKKSKKVAETKPSEVDNRINKELLTKAVKALLKHHENTSAGKDDDKNQLLGNETTVQVQITLEVAPTEPSRKPLIIQIPHPIYRVSDDEKNDDLDVPEVCLFVKSDSKAEVKEMIEQFPEQMGFVKKVMGLDSLRTKYAQYSQRRELLKQYNVFMADTRILPMMTKSLGRDFLKAKKHPIPVNITRKTTLPLNILKALSSTYLHLSEGDCVTVRAGYTSMDVTQLVENILAVLENGVPRIPRKWANIRAVAIKTPTSTSLPFYNKTPAELAEIARLSGISQVWKESGKPAKEDAKMEQESPKKRKEAKSPLLQALKKRKKDNGDDETKEKVTPEKTAVQPPSETSSKKKQKKKSEIAEKKDETPKKPKSTTKEKDSEKRDFIASPKFEGSKKGYVFRKGPKGLGYYVDIKPVPDKAALAALARMNKGTPNSKRKSSTKKGRGRRSF